MYDDFSSKKKLFINLFMKDPEKVDFSQFLSSADEFASDNSSENEVQWDINETILIFHIGPEIVFTTMAVVLFIRLNISFEKKNKFLTTSLFSVLLRFVYECDFALDFGFYESSPYKRPSPGSPSCAENLSKKIQNRRARMSKCFKQNEAKTARKSQYYEEEDTKTTFVYSTHNRLAASHRIFFQNIYF